MIGFIPEPSDEYDWTIERLSLDVKERTQGSHFTRYQTDPVLFGSEVLGETWWSKQREIAISVRDNERTAVKSGFDLGKSFIAARLAAWFLSSFENSIVFTTAPTNRQVKNILWRYLRSAHRKGGLPGRCGVQEWNIQDDWYAFGSSPRDYDPTSIQGIHAPRVLAIVDEAEGVPRQIHDAIEGLLGGDLCRLLLIGNPEDPAGPFADCFRSELYNCITISAFDSPNVTGEMEIPGLVGQKWIDTQKKRGMEGSAWWVSRVLGQFPEAGADTLITLRQIQRALDRPELTDAGPMVLPPDARVVVGVDVARRGPDNSALAAMKGGLKLLELQQAHGWDTVQTANYAAQMAKRHSAYKIRVDGLGGLGVAVYDQLLAMKNDGSLSCQVEDVRVSDPARDAEQFFNMRSEIWWNMRLDLEADLVDLSAVKPDDRQDVIRDFTILRYGFRKAKIYVEDKEEMHTKRKPSTDRADAILLAREVGRSEHVISFLDDDYLEDD